MSGGIAVAGNMIVDVIKLITTFPVRHGLVNITEKGYSLGGLACNVLGSLARLDPELPLAALSMVGEDEEGNFILRELGKFKNIDLSMVRRDGITSFTDVLTEQDTKARTFLFYSGADGKFDIQHVPLDDLECDIFHAGYQLLLPALDASDAEYGTHMARLLHMVQQRGIKTSLDVVSEVGDRFNKLVPPSLKYVDYFIVNEIEAGSTASIPLRDENERLMIERVPDVLSKLKDMGVSHWAVIHAPEGGFGMDEHGRYVELPSLMLPDGFIQGTVGAGDAFCAGCLYAAYKGESIETGLQYGVSTAALSLSAPGGSEGVKPIADAIKLYNELPKQSFERER